MDGINLEPGALNNTITGVRATGFYAAVYVMAGSNGNLIDSNTFTNNTELDKNNAECHLALGSTYARLREPEKGAQHYREFLRLAPTHDRAEEVRRLLQDYEDQRTKQK